MDFLDSPDVEKDFPGLYASDGAEGKSKRGCKEESDYSEGEQEKIGGKRSDLLLGRRKEKKEKGKDRGYAALEGESSPDDEVDAKSPKSKSKSKPFKFGSSKMKEKEKREKSREKETTEERPPEKEEQQQQQQQPTKRKDKERKEKEKKEKGKEKERERKEKKDKGKGQMVPVSSSISLEESLELGSPVFGVSISLATDRSRCHDGIDIPLVVRDCIDYLQEFALKNEQIYRVEPMKTRLIQYKRLYNNRERQPEEDELDVATACGLLKLFLRELPEPILTTDLISNFEEVISSNNNSDDIPKQLQQLRELIDLLPSCNQTLLSWILKHFSVVIDYEKYNKINAQTLSMLLSPTLQMSHRLLVALIVHCPMLFPRLELIKYIPPLTSSSPKLPDTVDEIHLELGKQESLLNQIHAEMNAGFVSKKREEQLWEVQRIITQLKRKLRLLEKKIDKSVEKSMEKSIDNDDRQVEISKDSIRTMSSNVINKQTTVDTDVEEEERSSRDSITVNKTPDKESLPSGGQIPIVATSETLPSSPELKGETSADVLHLDETSGLLLLPKKHPDYYNLIQLQLENHELLLWKKQLQNRITAERAEILSLKQKLQQVEKLLVTNNNNNSDNEMIPPPIDLVEAALIKDPTCLESLIDHYFRENTALEQRKLLLSKEIFEETKQCIAMQVDLAMQQF